MFLVNTRKFPPDLGGMQILMGGLSTALLNYGPVKIFAEKHKNSDTYDKKFQYDITRISGIKLLKVLDLCKKAAPKMVSLLI